MVGLARVPARVRGAAAGVCGAGPAGAETRPGGGGLEPPALPAFQHPVIRARPPGTPLSGNSVWGGIQPLGTCVLAARCTPNPLPLKRWLCVFCTAAHAA